jgi:hypothetical protein
MIARLPTAGKARDKKTGRSRCGPVAEIAGRGTLGADVACVNAIELASASSARRFVDRAVINANCNQAIAILSLAMSPGRELCDMRITKKHHEMKAP